MNDILRSSGYSMKPPLGLRPGNCVGARESVCFRRTEIIMAMWRYSTANKHIPAEWFEELQHLNIALEPA